MRPSKANRMRIGLAGLLLVAFLVPLLSGGMAGSAIAPGCTATGLAVHECQYISQGGRVVGAGVHGYWSRVFWSYDPQDPYAVECGSEYRSYIPLAVVCGVPPGALVTAGVYQGIITVRDLPGNM